MDKQNEVMEIDMVQMLKAIWHRIWLVVALAVIGGAIAFSWATFVIAPTYRSSAQMYVNSGSVNFGEMKMTVSDLSFSSNLVKYYISILNTRTTLNRVIEEAELNYTYEQLSKMITAEAVNQTGIFEISVTSTDPYEAEEIANTITQVLPERIEEIMEGTSARVVDHAVVPETKDGPSITKYTAIGLLLGTVVAVAIIVVSELLDDMIHGGDYVTENFGIPVLAEIPDLLGEKNLGKYAKYEKYERYYYKYATSGNAYAHSAGKEQKK